MEKEEKDRENRNKPKICVPVMGRNVEELLEQAACAVAGPCDMVEWRMDYFPQAEGAFVHMPPDGYQEGFPCRLAEQIKRVIGEKLLLATFRTKREGGEKEIAAKEYEALLRCVANAGAVDWIDVEYAMLGDMTETLVADLKACGKVIVLSSHDFGKTPSEQEMFSKLAGMAENGADIGKLAVMPEKEEDVLSLLHVTLKAKRNLPIPVITMSMSEMGMISRICGELCGSAVTFGCAEKASAPGQIPVKELASCLELLHMIPME